MTSFFNAVGRRKKRGQGHMDAELLQGTTRADWAFLEPWIDVLEGRLTTRSEESDGVPGDVDACGGDFWIEVQLRREEQLQIHQDGEQAAMALLREAVVLVHLLGISNYDVWYEWLVGESRVYTPPQWFIPQNSTIPMRYAFTFVEEHDEGFMDWEPSLGFLLGDVGWSDEFRRDLKTAQKLLARHGLKWGELEPLDLKLCIFSEDFGDVDVSLKCLTRAVVEVEKIESAARQNRGEGLGLGPRFKVFELEVCIEGETMTSRSFEALHELLRLGVPVGTLRLPRLPLVAVEEERLASLKDIVGFFRTILGLTADRGRPPTQVRRLVMPSFYARTRWFAPFCSALASSRFLRVLQIVPQVTTGHAMAGFGPAGPARHRAWSWLAFAMFSSSSTSSVESLALSGWSLLDADVDAIKAIIASSDPIAQLDTLPNEQARSGILANRFLAHRRASLELARTRVCTRKRLHTQSTSTTDEITPQPKKQRVEPTKSSSHATGKGGSAFKTLTIVSSRPHSSLMDQKTDPHVDQYLRLLCLLGARVRGLTIEGSEVNNHHVQNLLALCPNLESLDLRNTSLTSLDILRDVDFQHHPPQVSLHVSSACVHSNLATVLNDLVHPNGTKASLRRLKLEITKDFGLVCMLIKKILSSNKILSHLHLKVPSEEKPRFAREIQHKFHGQSLKAITMEDSNRRVAFFSVLRCLAGRNQALEIDRDVRELVLQFATPVVRRRCVTINTFKT